MPETILSVSDGRVQCEHTKLAIIGAGWGRDTFPWEDESWCVQALNEIYQPRFDRHWELHPMAVQNERELAWLASCPTPCYVLDLAEAQGKVANAVEYPLERVLDVTKGRRYFTCTFAFQVALAVADGFKEIGLWGVELDFGTIRERLVEKPCVEYWLGLAEGRGVKVTLPLGSTLLQRDYLYGYDYDEELSAIKRVCEEALVGLPKADWPRLLQRLGARYGGRLETALTQAAAAIGQR